MKGQKSRIFFSEHVFGKKVRIIPIEWNKPPLVDSAASHIPPGHVNSCKEFTLTPTVTDKSERWGNTENPQIKRRHNRFRLHVLRLWQIPAKPVPLDRIGEIYFRRWDGDGIGEFSIPGRWEIWDLQLSMDPGSKI